VVHLNPRHHPSSPRLAAYAAGDLALAPALVLSAHLETCVACRHQVRESEEREGERLEASEPAPLRAEALDHALAAIEVALSPQADMGNTARRLGDVPLPAAVRPLGLEDRRFLAPGLWAAPVRTPIVDGWRTLLLRTPPGTVVPTHGHKGGELIAVLSGRFHDGVDYRAGDFAESVIRHDHGLEAGPEEPCVCLIAIQGRVQWRGWAKVIGPVLGM
jgi:putative transcriptional regulator